MAGELEREAVEVLGFDLEPVFAVKRASMEARTPGVRYRSAPSKPGVLVSAADEADALRIRPRRNFANQSKMAPSL